MSALPGAKEYRFKMSQWGNLEEVSGHQADIYRIRNLLFGHGIVGNSKLGIDLQSFLFELATDEKISEIESSIREGIKTYCPGVNVLSLVVEMLDEKESPTGRSNALVIGISIGSVDRPYSYGFMLDQKDASGVVLSEFNL